MNKIMDFNIHLTPDLDFKKDLDLTLFDPIKSFKKINEKIKSSLIFKANFMILDVNFLRRNNFTLLREIHSCNHTSTLLIDPRDNDSLELVDKASDLGCSGIKFHSYFLNLADHDFPSAIKIAQRAHEKNLWLAICCSYGTSKLYDVSGVRLLSAISRAVPNLKIIALHAGGKLVLDVMSIAMENKNIYLETSFSLPFWLGSSIEQDFVFAMRKLGSERWLYGSDHPYQDYEKSYFKIENFFETHSFSTTERKFIMCDTFLNNLN